MLANEKKFKIGVVAFELGIIKGFENVRSAHIQVPMQYIKRLSESGSKVTLFTNEFGKNTSPSTCLDQTEIVIIPDPRKRNNKSVMHSGFSKKINVINIIYGIFRLVSLSKLHKIEILHFFNGGLSVGIYAAIVALYSKKTKVFWTPSAHISTNSYVVKLILSRLNSVVASTEYHQLNFSKVFKDVPIIRYGTTRDLNLTNLKTTKRRVTFWRDPSYENGMDIAIKVFESLAPEFPNIIFTFMIRPYFDTIKVKTNYKNIEVHQYPYSTDIDLESVLSETAVCLFPFREFSTNPQLSIIETLEAGIPCVCSDIESAKEYGIKNKLLIKNNNIQDYIDAIRYVLLDYDNLTPIDPKKIGFSWNGFVEKNNELYKTR